MRNYTSSEVCGVSFVKFYHVSKGRRTDQSNANCPTLFPDWGMKLQINTQGHKT